MKVYKFQIILKHRRSTWAKIKIKGNSKLAEFDKFIRTTFNHDSMSHLSEFIKTKSNKKEYLGVINPDGKGEGANILIDALHLTIGDKLTYVYDLGSKIEYMIILEEILSEIHQEASNELKETLPKIIEKSRSRIRYCTICKKKGIKTPALWICIDCFEETGKSVMLCDRCLIKYHNLHYVEEVR